MHTLNPVFWAKKSDKKGRYQWLPLSQHLEDTRRVSGLLWELWLSESQKSIIIKSIEGGDVESAKNLVTFLGAIHDLGKITPVFQVKRGFQNSTGLDQRLIDQLLAEGFGGLNNLDLTNGKITPHALAGQMLLTSYGVNEDVASIIGGHHGRPIDGLNDLEIQKSYKSNYFQEERDDDPLNALWRENQKLYFDRALLLSGFESAQAIPEISQPGQVILSGLLIMADWIASNEHYFPLLDLDQDHKVSQIQRVETGWKRWFTTSPISQMSQPAIDDLYYNRFKFSPRDVQRKMAEVIEVSKNPGLFILEAPMGQGKTEAALVGAEQLMAKLGASGLFFGLPTQATSNGIFPRIKDWLDLFVQSVGSADKASLQLVHGKAALNEEYSRMSLIDGEKLNFPELDHGDSAFTETELPDASQVNIDGGEKSDHEETVVVNQWFTGRKTTALDDFVVGTVDQFLLAALKQKHLALRHLGFSKKVVVIDEVHAYDAYMNQYLLEAIKWMGAYNVPVIILSATLPASRREGLAFAYIQGKGLDKKEIKLPENGLKYDAYPLITYTDGSKIKQTDDFKPIEEKRVEIEKIHSDQLMGLLDRLMEKEGVIGIIVNTVKKAQEMAKVCSEKYGSDLVDLLHSNFIATDRIKKEDQLLDQIGKKAKRPKQKIIIGTQVIEQSLDIDFDVMISDLAPMDLLIQRVGRLHRHDIERPDHYRKAKLFVMGTDGDFEFEEGSSAVYGGYLLARTQYFLPNQIVLPNDISPLVQKVYQETELDLPSELVDRYQEMKGEHESLKDSKQVRANDFKLGAPRYTTRRKKRKSLIGWLKNIHPNESEEFGYAQVRDIEETIEVIAVRKIENGYAFFGDKKDISSCLSDSRYAKKLALQTLKLPRYLSKPGVIDSTINELEAYNRKHLPSWQSQKWLKGCLGIIFDEDNNFDVNGLRLHYDKKYGLMYERMEDSGQI